MGVPPTRLRYWEIVDPSPKGTFAQEGDHATKIIHCRWDQLRDVLAAFRGYPYLWEGVRQIPLARTFHLGRILPQPFSLFFDNLYCAGADLLGSYGNPRPQHLEDPQLTALASQRFDSGFADSGDLVFDFAQVQLNYTTLLHRLAGNSTAWDGRAGELCRFVARKTAYAADNIPVPSGSFKWATAPHDAIQEGGVPKTFPTRELVYTWCEIPEDVMPIVRARIDACSGKVNLAPFDRTPEGGGLNGYPAQTILFMTAEEIPRRRLWNGSLLYDLAFRFLKRDNGANADGTRAGWNHLYRGPGASPQFQLATADGTAAGTRIYQTADLNALFSVNPTGLGLGFGV